MKKFAYMALALVLTVTGGIYYKVKIQPEITLNSLNTDYEVASAADLEDDSIFINQPLKAGDTSVSGIFSNVHTDVFVYVYVNERFQNFKRVVGQNTFTVDLKEPLVGQDVVKVDINAYDSYDQFSSRRVIVEGDAPVSQTQIEESKKVEFGPFSVDEAIRAGDTVLPVLFNQVVRRGMLTVKIDGKLAMKKYVFKTDRITLKLKQALRRGQLIEMSLLKYEGGETLKGSVKVAK